MGKEEEREEKGQGEEIERGREERERRLET